MKHIRNQWNPIRLTVLLEIMVQSSMVYEVV